MCQVFLPYVFGLLIFPIQGALSLAKADLLLDDLRSSQLGGLGLLQASREARSPWHSAKARASLDSAGLPTLEFDEAEQLSGDALEKAALAAAARAVRAEIAAARGGHASSRSRLLASSHHSDFQKMHRLGRFEVINDESNESRGNSSSPKIVNQSSPWPLSSQGVNPFNPFTNPFFNPFTPNPYGPLHTGGGRGSNALFVLIVVVLAAAGCAVACGGVVEDEEDSSSGDDSSSGGLWGLNEGARRNRDKMMKKVNADGDRHRNCGSWCSCFGCCRYCSKTVILFTVGALFVTFVGAKILWNSGILQPLLAQLLLYAYVILIILGFAIVIMHELTRKIRRTIDSINRNILGFVDNVPGIFKKKGESY